jgi:uncharacterized protein (TIGR02147 family)
MQQSGQIAVQKALTQAFLESRARNPAFSLRAFARKLKLSPSAVSEILKGKRRISREMAGRLTETLCLNPREARALLSLFPRPKGESQSAPESEFLELSVDHFHMVSSWHHFAILSLAETRGFKGEARWIAGRLGLRTTEAQEALDRLERLGLLKRVPKSKGALAPTGAQYSTPDGTPSAALRKAHGDNLELARKSLERDDVSERDFTSMTMAIDPARLPVAKGMIREFMGTLADYLESGPKAEVYKACFQLFPLTELNSKTTEERS